MGTRSTIAVEHADGKVSQIYCHWDGYVSYNGRLLVENYNSLEKVEELVALGDMSSLGAHITPTGEHSFRAPEEGCCVFYARDRGETHCDARLFDTVFDYKLQAQAEEFNYLFADGEWIVSRDNTKKFFPVAGMLKETA